MPVRLSTDAAELHDRFQDFIPLPEQNFPPQAGLSFGVFGSEGGYTVRQERDLFSSLSLEWAVLHLEELVGHRVRIKYPGRLKVHGGCATYNGRRIMVIGPKGAGKTTLLCKLLFAGADVHCDEHVLIGNDGAVPFPRRFHVKEGMFAHVKELEGYIKNLSPYPSNAGGLLYHFDPLTAGRSWTVSEGKIDMLFSLEGKRDERSILKPLPKWQAMQRLIMQIDNFDPAPQHQIERLCEAVDSCDCYRLYPGDTDSAVREVLGVLC